MNFNNQVAARCAETARSIRIQAALIAQLNPQLAADEIARAKKLEDRAKQIEAAHF